MRRAVFQDGGDFLSFSDGGGQAVVDTLTERERRLAARERAANAAFLDDLIAAGHVASSHRELLLGFVERLEQGEGITIAFGEHGAPRDVSAAEAFLCWLASRPLRVAFGEGGSAAHVPSRHVRPLAIPRNFSADRRQLAFRDEALAYAEEHKIDFIEAVKILTGA